MSDEENPNADLLSRIARLDRVIDDLLSAAEDNETPAKVKASLFTTIMSWQKQRAKLLPTIEGNELKRMSDALKSPSHKRNGSSGPKQHAKPGAAIEAIISDLKRKSASRASAANAADPVADSPDPVSEGGGDAGAASGVRPDSRGNGSRHLDGALDIPVL